MALTQISTAGVKDDAVTAGKIPANAVGSSEIAANAVGSSELADNAVDTAAIATDAVTGPKIADDAIGSNHYVDGSINAAHLNSSAVTTSKLNNNAVDATKIADNAVTTAKIADDAITNAKIADNAIQTVQIAVSQVTSNRIADQAVTLAKLPHGDGSSDGKFLRANNGADPTFESVTSPAITSIAGDANDRVIVSDGDGTATCSNQMQFDGNILQLMGTNNSSAFQINPGSNAGTIVLDRNGYITSMIRASDGGSNVAGSSGGGSRIQLAKEKIHFRTFPYVSNIGDAVTYTTRASVTTDGITFNGDTASNNALDDYEEGNWTPAYSRPNMTLGLANQFGRYVKIGKVVHIVGKLNTTSETGSSSGGPIIVTGLPFTVRETRSALSVRPSTWSNDHPSFATFELNQTHFELLEEVEGNPSGSSDLGGGRFAGGTGNYLWFGGTYFTDT